eukprot:GHVT01084493.1.p1 GENE.GHVT01084493.1~~GHVT01084493.1.p1  ORF type:complete len:135 (+),score=29.14 GHVT01084493.1:483-887(+)
MSSSSDCLTAPTNAQTGLAARGQAPSSRASEVSTYTEANWRLSNLPLELAARASPPHATPHMPRLLTLTRLLVLLRAQPSAGKPRRAQRHSSMRSRRHHPAGQRVWPLAGVRGTAHRPQVGQRTLSTQTRKDDN